MPAVAGEDDYLCSPLLVTIADFTPLNLVWKVL
jgi:hypothetical protein